MKKKLKLRGTKQDLGRAPLVPAGAPKPASGPGAGGQHALLVLAPQNRNSNQGGAWLAGFTPTCSPAGCNLPVMVCLILSNRARLGSYENQSRPKSSTGAALHLLSPIKKNYPRNLE